MRMSEKECILEKVIESQWMVFRATVENLTSTVTAGNIAEIGANELQFLDLVMGRWSFHSLFSIF